MKQFSAYCNEQSIVFECNDESEEIPKTTISFPAIKEKFILSEISWFSLIMAIIIDAVLIFLTIGKGINSSVFLAVLAFILVGSLKFTNAVEKIIKINFTKEGRKISRLHSAMHKAINAIIAEDTIAPDISKIKKASRFSNSCNSVYTYESILLGLFSIPIVYFTHQHILVCLILLILLRVLVENLLDYGVFNFLQILVLRKPTDKEINFISEMLNKNNELINNFNKAFPNS